MAALSSVRSRPRARPAGHRDHDQKHATDQVGHAADVMPGRECAGGDAGKQNDEKPADHTPASALRMKNSAALNEAATMNANLIIVFYSSLRLRRLRM